MRELVNWVWNHRGTVGVIVFVLCLVAGMQIYHEEQITAAKKATLAACQRGNALRHTLNIRGDVNRDFYLSAANTRERSADLHEKNGETAQADIDKAAVKDYRAAAKAYKSIPYIACRESYNQGRTIYVYPDSKTSNPAGKSKLSDS